MRRVVDMDWTIAIILILPLMMCLRTPARNSMRVWASDVYPSDLWTCVHILPPNNITADDETLRTKMIHATGSSSDWMLGVFRVSR